MSDAPPNPPKFESQKERWVKYGANVALASVIVILLAGVVVYLAQKTGRRIDTTASGAYSLKPQTKNILNDIKTKIRLVSLYRDEVRDETDPRRMKRSPYVDPVRDLLDEYRRNSSKIDVENIDPVRNNAKVEQLINDVSGKYGGEVQKYKAAIDAYPKAYDQLKAIAAAEAPKVEKLPLDQLGQTDDAQRAVAAIRQTRAWPKVLESSDQEIKDLQSNKPPDYKGATNEIRDRMDDINANATATIDIFTAGKDNKEFPEPIRAYMAAAIPTYQQVKKLTEDTKKQTENLGELKLDDLRRSLNSIDTILVIGDTDLRVIPRTEVFPADDREQRNLPPGQTPKPKFAGEQQISTAILGLNQGQKRKVAFVRAGGPPLTTQMPFPFPGGPMSEVASRLKLYNFEVLEKDLSGMWAMQAQMQQQPAPPDATDEQIKDAIWIVMATSQQRQDPRMPQLPIGPKVAEHLNAGGSAMILFDLQADAMADTLKQWGITVNSDAIAVHSMIEQSQGRQGDMFEEALRYPFIFDIRDYGDHAITKPLRSLGSLFLPLLPVKVAEGKDAPAGVKVTPILPMPAGQEVWGEKSYEGVRNWSEIKNDKDTDVAPPFVGGAVAENAKGNRLVVIGSSRFAENDLVQQPDVNTYRTTGRIVARFPANAELFANSVFWLAKMESMMAISPAAMEVARIGPMTPTEAGIWKNGVLLVGLPGVIVLAGALVWAARRD
jgi:hypothetical protein